MITAHTITDEQILELRDRDGATPSLKSQCNLALLAPGGVGRKHEYELARAKCADLLVTESLEWLHDEVTKWGGGVGSERFLKRVALALSALDTILNTKNARVTK